MEIDLSRLDGRLRQTLDGTFRDKFHRELAGAVTRQTRTAKARENGLRWRDDLMPQYEIDPFVDSLWRQYYGHNYTENPDLMKFLMARNPEIKIRARSGKIQVGYNGRKAEILKTESRNKRGCRFDRGTLKLAT